MTAAAHAARRPAAFIDRDDTILDTRAATSHLPRPGDLYDPGLVRFMPGAIDALKRLHAAGFAIVVYSNQGGIARGPMHPGDAPPTLRDIERVNDAMRTELAHAGVPIAGVYVCPFHPNGVVPRFTREHDWRKPAPGMILAAATELDLDFTRSIAIGDQPRDVQCAAAAGIAPARTALIGTTAAPNADAPDLAAAVTALLTAH